MNLLHSTHLGQALVTPIAPAPSIAHHRPLPWLQPCRASQHKGPRKAVRAVEPAESALLGSLKLPQSRLGFPLSSSRGMLVTNHASAMNSTREVFKLNPASFIDFPDHSEYHAYASHDFGDLTEDEDHSSASVNPSGSMSDSDLKGGKESATTNFSKANYEVMRLDGSGRVRRFYARRRDLLREHKLQPRDLRRIDPTVDNASKASPSISIKEDVLLLCLGGIRAIVTAEKALLFEPSSPATLKFMELCLPRLTAPVGSPVQDTYGSPFLPSGKAAAVGVGHAEYMGRFYKSENKQPRSPPFELEVLEAALMVATGRIEAEMRTITNRVTLLSTKLPNDISPLNLEELRRVKQSLVELETKAENLRVLLEELMDDEDELREFNLSSRPRREERKRLRERDRLERELERAREIREEIEERRSANHDEARRSMNSMDDSNYGPNARGNGASHSSGPGITPPLGSKPNVDRLTGRPPGLGLGGANGSEAVAHMREQRQDRLAALRSKYERGADFRSQADQQRDPVGSSHHANGSRFSMNNGNGLLTPSFANSSSATGSSKSASSMNSSSMDGEVREERERRRQGSMDGDDWNSRLEGSEEDIKDAQDALEEMVEEEEEEVELEEVEDLFEYYLQRASYIHSDSERLLAGARDLEESISVSLSARRYEVNRLELMLSMGSFAAAIGAMVAGIFGMNMRHQLEQSIASFWGVTAGIVLGCLYIFVAIMRYTQRKRIL